jgi:CDP-diacylglycerol pyrophosphatase
LSEDKNDKHLSRKLDPNARLVDFSHIEISDIDPEVRKKLQLHLKNAKMNLVKLQQLFAVR